MTPEIFSDLHLARRLERAEALANASFVDARATLAPDLHPEWIYVSGTYAMFDGPRSPCTQTFGLGLFHPPTAAGLDTIETFFKDRRAPVIHEVSPLADPALLTILPGRNYRPIELTTVLFQSLTAQTPTLSPIHAHPVAAADSDLWARTVAEGWRESVGIGDLLKDLTRVIGASKGTVPFLAELDNQPIAAGSLCIHEGVALLAGASTISEWRHRGAQRALLEARLNYAANAGCDLVMMCTAPGSASQRNAERQGFRIAYTRIKWSLTDSSG